MRVDGGEGGKVALATTALGKVPLSTPCGPPTPPLT